LSKGNLHSQLSTKGERIIAAQNTAFVIENKNANELRGNPETKEMYSPVRKHVNQDGYYLPHVHFSN
jgi:hypothetical protein